MFLGRTISKQFLESVYSSYVYVGCHVYPSNLWALSLSASFVPMVGCFLPPPRCILIRKCCCMSEWSPHTGTNWSGKVPGELWNPLKIVKFQWVVLHMIIWILARFGKFVTNMSPLLPSPFPWVIPGLCACAKVNRSKIESQIYLHRLKYGNTISPKLTK